MKPLLCFALLATITSFIACQKDEPYNPYPVWLLEAHVREESATGILQEVLGCPQGIFRVMPTGNDSTVNCHDNQSYVKIWDHIDSTITIEYYIHCNGYYDSEPVQRTFRVEDAFEAPGRDGPEVTVRDTVILQPN